MKSCLTGIWGGGSTCGFLTCQNLPFQSMTEDEQGQHRMPEFWLALHHSIAFPSGAEISNCLTRCDIIGKCHLHEILCLTFQADIYPAVINYLNSSWEILLLQHLLRILTDLQLDTQLLSQWFPRWPEASGGAMCPDSRLYLTVCHLAVVLTLDYNTVAEQSCRKEGKDSSFWQPHHPWNADKSERGIFKVALGQFTWKRLATSQCSQMWDDLGLASYA